MMLSAAGKGAVRLGRKESWGAILRARFVRAVVLWPRLGTSIALQRAVVASSWATGRARDRRSMVCVWRVMASVV